MIVVNGVTDWTGCTFTRRSTSGVAGQFGQHLWHRPTTQVLVTLSCGEAETCGLIKNCSRALGVKKLAYDLGIGQLLVEVCVETAQKRSACRSGGAGKIRHLEAGCLWIQGAIKKLEIRQVDQHIGILDPSDILTKGVAREDVEPLCICM